MLTLASWFASILADVAAAYPFADWLQDEGMQSREERVRAFLPVLSNATKIWIAQGRVIGVLSATHCAYLYLDENELAAESYVRDRITSDDETNIDLMGKMTPNHVKVLL